jgi:tetratricopeptide (TPR) repeat protein
MGSIGNEVAMKKNTTLGEFLAVMLCIVALMAVVSIPATAGAGPHVITLTDDDDVKEEKKQEKQWKKAVEYLEWGWDEVDKADMKLEEGKPRKAQEHFAVALDFFNKAIKHFVKATLGPEQQQGYENIEKGLRDLEKADKAYDEDKLEKGAKLFASAQELLTKGMATFNDDE